MPANYVITTTFVYGLAFLASAAQFYVSPAGSPAADGSARHPWDLQTALNHPAPVKPGDTIWLRGGVHRRFGRSTRFTSRLSGLTEAPITVRQVPGERAIIDGSMEQESGQWTTYWGFEIMNSSPDRTTRETGSSPTTFTVNFNGEEVNLCRTGFDVRAPGIKLINLVIHDVIGSGIFLSASAAQTEIYGVLSYYNGWQGCDRGHGHGIYAQSQSTSRTKIEDCAFFTNFGYGIHAYGVNAPVDNLTFLGNVIFCNSALASRHQANFLIGRETSYASNPVIAFNFVFDPQGGDADVDLGYSQGLHTPVLYRNYFQTGVTFATQNVAQVLLGNTFLAGTANLGKTNHPNNIYTRVRPTTNLVEVRSNVYETGRASIIVYNWEHLSEVAVEVGHILASGMLFEVRSAQDYFGRPVLCGVYDGNPLILPMAGLSVSKPVGVAAPASTAPDFSLFILLPRLVECGADATPPSISFVDDQRTIINTPIAEIPFQVSSERLPAECLTLSVHSSNPRLVPNPNLQVSGHSTNRGLTIVPARNEIGEAVITLAVSDGLMVNNSTFRLSVSPGLMATTENPPNPPVQKNASSGISPVIILAEGSALLRLTAGEPGTYQIQSSTDLIAWGTVETTTVYCEDGVVIYNAAINPEAPACFYRLQFLEQAHALLRAVE